MQKSKHIAGFSLVELLFAIALISVILLGVIKLQISNLALTNTQNSEVKANFLAMQGLAIVEGLGKSALNCTPPATSCTKYLQKNGSYSLGSTQEKIDIYTRSIIIADSDDASPTPNSLTSAYLVTAKIDWEDSTGPHSVSAKRIIYE